MGKIVNIFIILLLTLFGRKAMCGEDAPYSKYVREIVNEFEREMFKEYGFVCIGSGGKQATCVETIELIFWVYCRGTLDEVRELLVKSKTRLVEKVNSHEKIRPFLKKYPFTWERAAISLSFHKKDGSYFLDESVAFVCSSRGGKIAYDRMELQMQEMPGLQKLDGTFIPGKVQKNEVLVLILEEPYEETLRIVQSRNSSDKKALQ